MSGAGRLGERGVTKEGIQVSATGTATCLATSGAPLHSLPGSGEKKGERRRKRS